ANGLEYIIEAARILAQRRKDHIVLVLVGGGGKRPELEEMAHEYKLTNVIFSAPVPKLELAGLVAGCDVCMTIYRAAKEPGRRPGQDQAHLRWAWSPNKMFDALAAGKPVLINVPGWLGETIDNNKCGRCLDPYRPEALADALEELADKPQLCQEMGKNARALAERDFDRAKLARRLEEILLEACRMGRFPAHADIASGKKLHGQTSCPSYISPCPSVFPHVSVRVGEPFVSIIMPIRNEAAFIEQAIKSILHQDWPAEKMEILVVDGRSDDDTREIVEELSQADHRVKMLDNPRRIVPTGINIGLKAMQGDLFIRVDGHAEVAPDFVRKSIQCLREHPDAWVVGGYIETVANDYIGKVIASAMRSPIGVGNSRFRLGNYEGWVDTLAFGTHHKWIVEKIGYFDEELVRNQDDEFNLRINLAGGKIWMSKSIKSKYFPRGSLGKLWRQYFQYGFWRIRTLQKHKRPATFRQLVPLLFALSLLLWGFAGLFWRPFWILLTIETALYLMGLLAGAFGVGRKFGWQYALPAPLVFAILHFGYGLGSLWGVIRFLIFEGYGIKRGEEI
ncbi:MAG: glycosyltransferase, partial [Phycisphaerae bacterium]